MTTAFEQLPHFQFATPTVMVKASNGDELLVDAQALNAFIRRAESAYGKSNVTYCVGQDCPGMGKGSADSDPETGAELVLDCSGFAWWSTYRRGIWAHTQGKNWVQIQDPIPGSTVRYDARPGRKYGHSGVVIAPAEGGNFQTLDSTDAKSPPRKGSIVYRPDGRTKWLVKGGPNPRFLLSPEAILEVNGKKYPRPSNLLLAAAKRPAETFGIVALALVGVGVYLYSRKRA